MRYKILIEGGMITAPKYGDAGYDLYALSYEYLNTGVYVVSTGIAVEIPRGYVGIIKDRSSQAVLDVTTIGGVIDQSYRGEIKVLIQDSYFGENAAFKTRLGKFAQLLVVPCYVEPLELADELSVTERGEKGFGSTGV